MSLLPLLMNLNWDAYDPWELRRHGHENRLRSDWDLFGLGVSPQEVRIMSSMLPNMRNTALQQHQQDNKDHQLVAQGQPQIGKDGYQVLMDVQQFRPSEITVKTVDNNVIVEGKHEERQDAHGSITRQFRRKYQLPKNYDAKELISTLSSDGILTIKVPPPESSGGSNERIIQIQQTGPAHLNVKDNSAGDVDANKAAASATKKSGN